MRLKKPVARIQVSLNVHDDDAHTTMYTVVLEDVLFTLGIT